MDMMRVRILVYVCVLMSCDVHTHTASMKDSGEQAALQEALLLVELLKSEYARVLRERSLAENKISEKDLETCAPTAAPTDAVINTHTDTTMRFIEQSSTTEALEPYTAHSDRRSYPNYFPRRRFNNYRDYYGSYGPARPWRKMDYDNVFGPQPGLSPTNATAGQPTTVSVINSPTNTTLSSVSNTASTNASETPTSSTLLDTSSPSTIHSSTTVAATTPISVTLSVTTLKPTELTEATILSSTTLHTLTSLMNKQPTLISSRSSILSSAVNTIKNKKQQTKKSSASEKVKFQRKKLFLSVNVTTSKYEPEQAQVAAELEHELEAAIGSSTSLPSSHRWSLTWRPSTRLHLARSTPYVFPLPENHAFCYTNPKSSLCRTFIK